MPSRYVLGLDSGFASSGWALVELVDSNPSISLGVFRTEKKLNVKAADDNMRRGREIAVELQSILGEVVAICLEGASLPRNASTSHKLGMYYGLVAALSGIYDVPVVQVSPQALKKAVCGSSTAPKKDVASAIDRRFRKDFTIELLDKGIPRGMHEHAYDALAAVVACADSEVIRLARRMLAS